MRKPFNNCGRRGYSASILFALIVVAAMLFSGCEKEPPVQSDQSGQSDFSPTPGGRAPDFQVKTFDGGVFNLDAASDAPVVINFWASWCGPCRSEAAALQEAYERFGPEGVLFIGVALQDTLKGSKAFIEEFGLSFPIGPDEDGDIMKAYKVFGIPKTFVVVKGGVISYVHSGAITRKALTREIMGVL